MYFKGLPQKIDRFKAYPFPETFHLALHFQELIDAWNWNQPIYTSQLYNIDLLTLESKKKKT